MDNLTPANKAALMQRFAAVFPGIAFPKQVSDMPLDAQLKWAEVDPQAVQIMEGKLPADQTAWLLTNQLDSNIPAQPDPEAAKQAYLAEQEAKWAAQLQAQGEAQERQRITVEANRQASIDHMHAQLRAQNSAARGW